jgi:hypothetical protein
VGAREADTARDGQAALQAGRVAVFPDGRLLAAMPQLDVVIEATSSIREGGEPCDGPAEAGHYDRKKHARLKPRTTFETHAAEATHYVRNTRVSPASAGP